jgi:endo-1,4-beta-xylanase
VGVHSGQENLVTSGSYVDPILAVSEANGQQTQAFHLLWHEFGYYDRSLAPRPVEVRRAFAKSHVQNLVRKYSGRVEAWNVVNEAFTDQGEQRGAEVYGFGTMYPNWLWGISNDFLADAFRWAREADPNAQLYYNDYGIEVDGPKWNAVLAMVKRFKQNGVPIDGVGFQAHLELGDPNQVQIGVLLDHFRQLNELGVRVRVTELDVGIAKGVGDDKQRLEAQAELVWQVTTACLHAQDCDAINIWGLSDTYSWKSKPQFGGSPANRPTLFDTSFEPKPAYWWMQHALLRPKD